MSAATATIIVTAVKVGTDIYAAHKKAEAEKAAAAAQKTSTDQALAYSKERDAYERSTEANRYGAMMAQTAPFVSAGQNSAGAMSRFLGLPAPASAGPQAPTPVPGQPNSPNTGNYAFPDQSGGTRPPNPAASGAMITMRAPDGTQKQVPASEEQHWVQKGATRVS